MVRSHLWEREDVGAAITDALDAARRGESRTVLVVGEAGLGKTALLDRARAEASPDLDVGFGRGEQMEQALPFGVMHEVLGSLDEGDGIEALLGLGSAALEPGAPYYGTMRWLQARGNRPTLLAVDDLHWADAESLELLVFLARRLEGAPVAFVGTLRPWPRETEDSLLALAAGSDAVHVERLQPLSRPSAAALLADRVGGEIAADAEDHAWDVCQGNPLLIEQVAIAVAGGELVPNLARRLTRHDDHTDQLLLSRFAGVGRAGLTCARAGCVLGTSFRPDVVAAVVDLDEATTEAALDALWRAGLVRDGGEGALRFTHPLFAEALYTDLSSPRRRSLHARCFEALAARGLDAAAAEHAERADLVGDAGAVEVLERVGGQALRAGAVVSAAVHLRAAARFVGDRPRAAVSLALAEALVGSGEFAAGAVECRRLLAEPDLAWTDRVQALRVLGRASFLVGQHEPGHAALAEAVEVAVGHDSAEAVQPLLDQSMATWMAAGTSGALTLAARARELAADVADVTLRERAVAVWGKLALESGDPGGLEDVEAVGRRLLEQPDGAGLDPGELVWAWASVYMYAATANYTERHEEADHAFAVARAVAERDGGAPDASRALALYRADVLIRRGRLAEAWAEVSGARWSLDGNTGATAYVDRVAAEVALWQGRLEESETRCGWAEAGGADQWFVRLGLHHVRGLRLLWEGDERASDELLAAEEITRWAGVREPCMLQWAGHAVSAHLAVDRVDDARRVVAWLEDCAEPLPCRWPRIAAATGRAGLAWHDGDLVTAEAQAQAALALHDDVDLPLQRIESLLAYGELLRRAGRSSDARAPLADALEQAERCDAAWLAGRAADELALAGGRRRRRQGDRTALTPAEQRVADLAGAGLSNAEIARQLHLSVNTIESHLKHIFAKLGISSRRQLIAQRSR